MFGAGSQVSACSQVRKAGDLRGLPPPLNNVYETCMEKVWVGKKTRKSVELITVGISGVIHSNAHIMKSTFLVLFSCF